LSHYWLPYLVNDVVPRVLGKEIPTVHPVADSFSLLGIVVGVAVLPLAIIGTLLLIVKAALNF
jgi:hypothetical protein